MHAFADLSLQGDTPAVLPIGPDHVPAVLTHLLRHTDRDPLRGCIISLGPVKGYAVMRAACPASYAGVRSFHILSGSLISLTRVKIELLLFCLT